MKYVLVLLGVLLMAEVVQMAWRVGVGWEKKRALPDIDDEALLDERDVDLTPEEKQVITKDLTSKIKDVVEKERRKFGI